MARTWPDVPPFSGPRSESVMTGREVIEFGGRCASFVIFLEIPPDFGRTPHRLHQALVEAFGRIYSTVLQQVVHRDHLGDDRNILSGIQRHHDLRHGDVQNRRAITIQTRAIDDEVRIPIYELHDDLDPLLLTNGADAEHRRHIHQANTADLHVMSLELVAAPNQDFAAAPADDDHVVRHEAVATLHEVEHAL